MFENLKALLESGTLLAEISRLRLATERIAAALEDLAADRGATGRSRHVQQADPTQPPVEISYVDEAMQLELEEITTRLEAVRGMPPSEEEIMAEWDRRRAPTGKA